MYELSVACKYLLPRWRQLSVSIISLISIFVIALVVWLIVVFFSVTNGLEKYWISKFVTLAAPVKITPTEAYYRSYFYQVDTISEASNYQHKSIFEKQAASNSDPYSPDIDQDLPPYWPLPDRRADGQLIDPVKELFSAIEKIPNSVASTYETTFGNIRLSLNREYLARSIEEGDSEQAFLAQSTMIGSLEKENPYLDTNLLSPSPADMTNLAKSITVAAPLAQSDGSQNYRLLQAKSVQRRLTLFFESVHVQKLAPSAKGWSLPKEILPSKGQIEAVALLQAERVVQFIISDDRQKLFEEILANGHSAVKATIEFGRAGVFQADGKEFTTDVVPLIFRGKPFEATLIKDSLKQATSLSEVYFDISLPLQTIHLEGKVPLKGLEIADFSLNPSANVLWIHRLEDRYFLPSDPELGEGVLLPKNFRDAGVLVGDQGYIAYFSPTPSSIQEQRVAIFVAGFYDPGMIPVGGKLIFVDDKLTTAIRSAYSQQDKDGGNGVRLRLQDFSQAKEIKNRLEEALKERGVARYWNIETYHEYDFAKEILQQQKSDKNLFLVIAAVIIIVACSNIISMLIILVNDKKTEIGILRSMGAHSRSIATIFGLCGFTMGAIGSLVGIGLASATLHHLDQIISLFGHLQGHQMFNPTFYGKTMPNEISSEALLFVFALTALFSLMAGVVPAIKASLLKPSAILRSE